MEEKEKKIDLLKIAGVTAMAALFLTALILSTGCCPGYSGYSTGDDAGIAGNENHGNDNGAVTGREGDGNLPAETPLPGDQNSVDKTQI